MKHEGLSRREWIVAGVAALGIRGAEAKAIRIGCCSKIAELSAAANLGFDYIEPAAADIAAMSAEEFAEVKGRVFQSRIRCEAFNSFIRRKDLVVVGPAVQLNSVLEYVDSTLARCKELGASVVVWGSAGSRNVPPDFPRERAWDQIAEFLRGAAPLAGKHGVAISIEPLNKKESNIFNTGGEALRMVNQVNRPEIALMIDYYHLRMENEDLAIFDKAAGKINHLHFARPAGRLWPERVDEDPEYGAFFAKLRQIGWSGGLSVEGKGSLAVNGKATLDVLRQLSGAPA
jgi:D-psicose/D-tagatose/L-ribulose 3-epimerase